MQVKTFQVNPFGENCYVVYPAEEAACLVIDPGISNENEWSRIQAFLTQHRLTPERIMLTHCHSDHVMGTGYLTKAYPGLPVCGSMEDQNHLPSVQQQNSVFGVQADIHWSPITHDLHEGDTLRFPSLPSPSGAESPSIIQVLDCPGHSHHGLCYYLPESKLLFTGDVLFYGSVGRSDFGPSMGCDGRLLLEGIAQKLLTLPADVKVLPGHGMPTTIGQESQYNPYL